jgi:thioredoxin 1
MEQYALRRPDGKSFTGAFSKKQTSTQTIKTTTMRFNEIIESDKPVLVDFHAVWCGPCKTMAPRLKEVKDTLGDAVTIIKVDVDKNPQAADTYQVRSVPTLILFKKGQILWRQSGVVPAASLVSVIRNHQH